MQIIPKTLHDVLLFFILLALPVLAMVGISILRTDGINGLQGGLPATTTPAGQSAFAGVHLTAKAAYVYDISTGQTLYAKNADKSLPLASITKIMTGLVTLEQIPEHASLVLRPEFLAEEGDSGLLVDERWDAKKLLDYTLVSSSNDGAAALASAAQSFFSARQSGGTIAKTFVDLMNDKAASLGLRSMHFNNPTGLDISMSEAGGYSSAEDLAKLLAYALKSRPELFEATKSIRTTISSKDAAHFAQNTNVAAPQIPGLIASKTGYTDLAGGNLAVIIDAGIQHPIAIVVLGSTYDERFSDTTKLVTATLESI